MLSQCWKSSPTLDQRLNICNVGLALFHCVSQFTPKIRLTGLAKYIVARDNHFLRGQPESGRGVLCIMLSISVLPGLVAGQPIFF